MDGQVDSHPWLCHFEALVLAYSKMAAKHPICVCYYYYDLCVEHHVCALLPSPQWGQGGQSGHKKQSVYILVCSEEERVQKVKSQAWYCVQTSSR
jgi:hypothetical protein